MLYLFDDADRYFDSSIQLGLRYPGKENIVLMALTETATIFNQKGDYEKSIQTADNGILFARGIKDSLSEELLLLQKAQAQVGLNRIPEADPNIKRAIDILERNEVTTDRLAGGYSIYADLLSKKKEYGKAVSYYQKAIRLYVEGSNWEGCSGILLNLGLLYEEELHEFPKALAYYRQGIKMAEKGNDVYGLSGFYINIGVVYWRQKNYRQALHYYQKALTTLPIHFTDTSISSNPSVDLLKQVSNDYYVSTLLSNKGEALLSQYGVDKNKELLQAALHTFQAADEAVDLMRWKQYAEQSKLFWREKTRKMYELAIETCYLLNDAENAFYFFEKSRAVLLNDKLSELGAKRFIALADRTKEQQLRIKVSSLNQKLSALPENSATYNVVKQQWLSAQEEWEKFVKSLERNYPVYYRYKYDNAVHPLSTVKSTLRQNNQALVEYFNGDSVVYVLFLSPLQDTVLKVSFKEYDTTAKELMSLCSNESLLKQHQNRARYSYLAYQLYDKLFRPLNVPEGRAIISPDDHFIPFEALLSNVDDPASFLLKKYAFSYAYSMGLLMNSGNRRSSGGDSFLGVAPINYQPYLGLTSLDGSDQSLEKIRSYFPSARFLIKEKASKEKFLETMPSFGIVQIYSHADADSLGKQPVLYLNDSVIDISEIQTLGDFQTNMIVLSACKTGVGKHAKGEGVFSLARAFMAAGIPSTVTTLWEVNNKATYQLTEAFYKYLSQGLPKDEALQKAKLEFLESNDKTYRLPYYWAANIVLGTTDTIKAKAAHRGVSCSVSYSGLIAYGCFGFSCCIQKVDEAYNRIDNKVNPFCILLNNLAVLCICI
jgi:CHAT domain-containing protein/Tfp pilus assembly protein PilF